LEWFWAQENEQGLSFFSTAGAWGQKLLYAMLKEFIHHVMLKTQVSSVVKFSDVYQA
jgi:hypothetical protein